MTQLNENMKVREAKIFFPCFRHILRKHGVINMEHVTLKAVCNHYKIDFTELLEEVTDSEAKKPINLVDVVNQ